MKLSPFEKGELKRNFDFELMSALTFGYKCSLGRGLDQPIVDAINEVADEWPNPSATTEAKAKQLFAMQMKSA